MPSWFSSSLKRNHHEQHQHQHQHQHQTPPPPPSLKARKLKEQAWQDAVEQQNTPSRTQPIPANLSIKYHQPPQRPNTSHRATPSISSSLSSTPQQQPHSSNPPSEEVEVLTQSLALRLQELATANNDGLLDDDEYRTLRKGLFDQINAGNQQPVLIQRPSNLALSSPLGSASFREPESSSQHQIPSQCNSPGPKSIHTNDRRSQYDAPTLRSARSTRSTSSFLHMIFRRPSRQMNGTAEEQMSEGRQRSTPSRAGSVHSAMYSDSGQSSLYTHPSAGGMRMGSNGQLSASMRPSATAPGDFSSPSSRRAESAYNDASPLPRRAPSQYLSASPSPRTINDHPQQAYHPAGLGSSSSQQDYRQIEWSSTEIKQEIAQLELECAKLLETFDEMERNLVAKYRTMPRSGPGGPVTKIEELDELLVLNQHQQQSQAASPTLTIGPSSSATVREPLPIPDDPLSARRQSSTRPTSFLAPLLNPRSFKPKSRSIYRDMRPSPTPALPPSSSASSSANENLLPHTEPPTPASRGLLFHQQQINALRSDPNQESELQVELNFIAHSRLKVAAKYQDRLVYLRAKLKGALIRELSS
ncbi:hypothetical protein PTTG_25185 [Puccinia triticina 1-1 BBBD Race 1]|uniref:Uncharacterized protein n=1 Tax=Puccinia triticina (isolate 1-1 / race 1 (BBBD)) TaxID=630390 RepID=A0A180H5D7_PUCT1|nr:hypothetical protein PTTG_25185 [Puccinia triticina 1-1 BBBD Race 1]